MRLFQSRYYIEGSVLLQSGEGITKWDNYYNVGFNTNFENLNSISKIFQKTHKFLPLTDPLIIFIYLRTTDRHFCD